MKLAEKINTLEKKMKIGNMIKGKDTKSKKLNFDKLNELRKNKIENLINEDKILYSSPEYVKLIESAARSISRTVKKEDVLTCIVAADMCPELFSYEPNAFLFDNYMKAETDKYKEYVSNLLGQINIESTDENIYHMHQIIRSLSGEEARPYSPLKISHLDRWMDRIIADRHIVPPVVSFFGSRISVPKLLFCTSKEKLILKHEKEEKYMGITTAIPELGPVVFNVDSRSETFNLRDLAWFNISKLLGCDFLTYLAGSKNKEYSTHLAQFHTKTRVFDDVFLHTKNVKALRYSIKEDDELNYYVSHNESLNFDKMISMMQINPTPDVIESSMNSIDGASLPDNLKSEVGMLTSTIAKDFVSKNRPLYVNTKLDYLGSRLESGKIIAKEAGDNAGYAINGGELIIEGDVGKDFCNHAIGGKVILKGKTRNCLNNANGVNAEIEYAEGNICKGMRSGNVIINKVGKGSTIGPVNDGHLEIKEYIGSPKGE